MLGLSLAVWADMPGAKGANGSMRVRGRFATRVADRANYRSPAALRGWVDPETLSVRWRKHGPPAEPAEARFRTRWVDEPTAIWVSTDDEGLDRRKVGWELERSACLEDLPGQESVAVRGREGVLRVGDAECALRDADLGFELRVRSERWDADPGPGWEPLMEWRYSQFVDQGP